MAFHFSVSLVHRLLFVDPLFPDLPNDPRICAYCCRQLLPRDMQLSSSTTSLAVFEILHVVLCIFPRMTDRQRRIKSGRPTAHSSRISTSQRTNNTPANYTHPHLHSKPLSHFKFLTLLSCSASGRDRALFPDDTIARFFPLVCGTRGKHFFHSIPGVCHSFLLGAHTPQWTPKRTRILPHLQMKPSHVLSLGLEKAKKTSNT